MLQVGSLSISQGRAGHVLPSYYLVPTTVRLHAALSHHPVKRGWLQVQRQNLAGVKRMRLLISGQAGGMVVA